MYVLTAWNLMTLMMVEEIRGGPGLCISLMFWDDAGAHSWETTLSVARSIAYLAKHRTWGSLIVMDNPGTSTWVMFSTAWALSHIALFMSSFTLGESSCQGGTKDRSCAIGHFVAFDTRFLSELPSWDKFFPVGPRHQLKPQARLSSRWPLIYSWAKTLIWDVSSLVSHAVDQ